ncbi:hypothetical protein HYH03_005377 [Edaphochlamys debaryana]|uniref:Uncharacterized protein n=1 Tax=Edaphochlamys debaryana TaxID=47281 RepID=A0A836C2G0_9CHLO|nr:hypothetical protein HYH03_005377 [Edaphochlamys debaryana]|eukprot:KAG2496554.1 hypothetical protein HYH03_005377 [Edaphochlamys debaryana]
MARTSDKLLLGVALVLFARTAYGQAQLTSLSSAVLVTSNADATVIRSVVDGNDTTVWQSGACFPNGYITRPAMNAALWRCNATSSGGCTASAGSTSLPSVTDGAAPGTSANIVAPLGGSAWVRVPLLGAPVTVARVGLRGIFPAAPASNPTAATAWLYVEIAPTVAGEQPRLVQVLAVNSSSSYAWLAAVGPWSGVSALYITAGATFAVTEAAAQTGPCYEGAAVDLGAEMDVGSVRVRYWPGSTVTASALLAAPDQGPSGLALAPGGLLASSTSLGFGGVTALVPTLDLSRLSALTLTLSPPIRARYIAVRHTVVEKDYSKAYVWGIDAFAPAPAPPPPPSPPPPPPPAEPVPDGWNALAGTVKAFSYGAKATVSSNPDPSALPCISDGNDNTQWQSDACHPTGYTLRPHMNPLLRLCATAGACTASAGSTDLASATDTSVYTSAIIAVPPGGGKAFLNVPIPGGPLEVKRVSLKAYSGASTPSVDVFLTFADGSRTKVYSLLPGSPDQYAWTRALGPWQNVVAVSVEASGGFSLTELAVQIAPCVEWAQVDMGKAYDVGMLRIRYWSPDALSSDFTVSEDGVSWDTIRSNMDPAMLSAVDIWLPALRRVRFMKITHRVKEDADWRKVYMWGMDAYDQYGRWGPPPAPVPHPVSLRSFLGVNGIWGWGFQEFSKTAVAKGKGPLYYTAIASRGRNYHGMNWDVRLPTNDPKYDTMSKTGTDAMWWLDWDREYVGWKSAGLKVDATFQFLADDQPVSTWGANVTATAYNLGYKFARHFGPGRAPPNVSLDTVEVGNEPWTYGADFYRKVLRGFAHGVKDADPTLRLLPCALQAAYPLAEAPDGGNFVGARIPYDVAPLLDGLNVHAYSWYNDIEAGGLRTGVHPEHPGTSMNEVNNFLSWRDVNMPGKPLWITEWGWDAHVPGEVCNTTVCVSQHAQALYAIRGLLVLARKGLAQATWFFYANADDGNGVFERSGLRGANNTGFPKLPVFVALESFMLRAGSLRFLGVAAERSGLYAYLLGPAPVPGASAVVDPVAAATHLMAWRPVAVGEGPEGDVAAWEGLALARSPGSQAWVFSGQGEAAVAVGDVVQGGGVGGAWSVRVSPAPLLIKLA